MYLKRKLLLLLMFMIFFINQINAQKSCRCEGGMTGNYRYFFMEYTTSGNCSDESAITGATLTLVDNNGRYHRYDTDGGMVMMFCYGV
jgi:hypothetical protein